LRVAALAACLAVSSAGAAGPTLTLNQFRQAETSEDAFSVSRPRVPAHLQLGTRLSLDYARDPLFYEAEVAPGRAVRFAAVRNEVVLNAGFSLGLGRRWAVFANLPAVLGMTGDRLPATVAIPANRGGALGDVLLGGRVVTFGTEESTARFGLQLAATVPSSQWGRRSATFAGDSFPTLQPALLTELLGNGYRVAIDLGANLRRKRNIAGLEVGSGMKGAVALLVPLNRDLFDRPLTAHAELFGSTNFARFGQGGHTPVEVTVGLTSAKEHPYWGGVAVGTGLLRGYGSPAFRAVLTLGFNPPAFGTKPPAAPTASAPRVAAQAPTPVEVPPPVRVVVEAPPAPVATESDADADGVRDEADTCPAAKGNAMTQGCPREVWELAFEKPLPFEPGGDWLTAEGFVGLQRVRGAITSNARIALVRIETNVLAGENAALAGRRANRIRDWLARHGVEPTRLELAPSDTPAAGEVPSVRFRIFLAEPGAPNP
jgi:hypothetical protein